MEGCRARDLTKPASCRRRSGRRHRTIAAVRTWETVQLSVHAGRPCCDFARSRAYRGVSVPRHPSLSRPSLPRRRAARVVAVLALAFTALGPSPAPAVAADGPTMDAHVLLAGHARLG